MATPQEIQQEQIRREQIRREQARRQQGGAPAAQAPVQNPAFDVEAFKASAPRPQPIGPELEKVGQTYDDFMNLFGSGYTYGLGNKLAGVPQEPARERLGMAAAPIEFAGGVLSPNVLGKARGVGTVARAGWNALEGGAGNVLQAYTAGAPVSELPGEFAKGAGLSGALSAVSSPVLKWWQRRKLKAAQPFKTDADLKAAKAKEYADVDASKAVYRARDLRSLHAQLKQMNLVPGVDDPAINVLKKLNKDWKGKNMTAAELDKAQQFIRQKVKGTGDQAANLQRVSGDMVDAMRKFEKNTPLMDRVVDPATGRVSYKPVSQDVKKSLETGRDLAAREQRGKSVNRMERRAQAQAHASRFSPFGQNLESARAQEAKLLKEKIVTGKTGTSKFTKAEEAEVEKLRKGTFRRDLGGKAEHLSISGRMLPAAAALSAIIPGLGPPVSAAGALVAGGAEALHRFGQRATNRQVEDIQALIRDPSGRGLKIDPKTVNEAKDKLAKIMSSGVRTSTAQRNRGEN